MDQRMTKVPKQPYLAERWCNLGDNDEERERFYDDPNWKYWYQSPEQINMYSPKDQERIRNDPLLLNLFGDPKWGIKERLRGLGNYY